jgi:RNA polymerase sigma-70 factor (ECF subfamily)
VTSHEADQALARKCIARDGRAWRAFVDRLLPVVYHVIHHSAHMRSVTLSPDAVDDLAADVMAVVIAEDFKVLRKYQAKASLATYITVIARRFVVNQLARNQAIQRRVARQSEKEPVFEIPPELRIDHEEEVEWLLGRLKGREADLVRGFYLEHKSYAELSVETGVPEESIGPLLSRIRAKLRRALRGSEA